MENILYAITCLVFFLIGYKLGKTNKIIDKQDIISIKETLKELKPHKKIKIFSTLQTKPQPQEKYQKEAENKFNE